MITLRKLPLAVAVAAGVMSAQAMAVDFHFQLWDPSQLPAFSWESEIFNERRKRPNAVKFYELAADEAVRMNDIEMCEFYLPKLFFAIKKSPLDKPSLLYRVAKIYRSLERFPEELDSMIQVVQLNSTVWTWNALGEAFNRNNPSKAIICWCKGYSFPGKGLLKLAIMKNVLSYCLEHKEIKVAQMLAEEIETVFSNNKWTLKGDLADNISRAKALAPKGMTPQSFIESHARKADKLITPIPKN